MKVDLDFDQVKNAVLQCSSEDLAEICIDSFGEIDADYDCLNVIKSILNIEIGHRSESGLYNIKENKELADFLTECAKTLMED